MTASRPDSPLDTIRTGIDVVAGQTYRIEMPVFTPEMLQALRAAIERFGEQIVRGFPVLPEPPEPEPDPVLALIEARRRRGPHGPQPKRRAPRRLDPSRRR